MILRVPTPTLLGLLFISAVGFMPPAAAQTSAPTIDTRSETSDSVMNRALALDAGKSVPRDTKAAVQLYHEAALAGDAFAHYRLGYFYETGEAVPQDYTQAYHHYQAAVAAGLNEARVRLAICLLEGWGCAPDRAAFAREMIAAAEAGDATAQRICGQIYATGIGVARDQAEAVKWLELAAKTGDAVSKYALGVRADEAWRRSLLADVSLARTWYQLSAEQEYLTGMRAMARTFLTGSRADRNWSLAHRWLELASNDGDPDAPYTLAVCELLHIDSPQHDEAKAKVWLQLADQRGNYSAHEAILLITLGRTPTDALRHMLMVPEEDRYVQRAASIPKDVANHKPIITRMVRPLFPESLRLADTTGEVMVDFIVDTTGRVQNAYAIKSNHPLFATRAVEAVNQWRFDPGRKDGRLVNTHMQAPIIFTLNDETMGGVDNLLGRARELAAGHPELVDDTKNLTLAFPTSPLPTPTLPDGSPAPAESRVLVVLVLGADGIPIRGHILDANPEALGPVVLQSALKGRFKPRVEEGIPAPSNALLVFFLPKGEAVLR